MFDAQLVADASEVSLHYAQLVSLRISEFILGRADSRRPCSSVAAAFVHERDVGGVQSLTSV